MQRIVKPATMSRRGFLALLGITAVTVDFGRVCLPDEQWIEVAIGPKGLVLNEYKFLLGRLEKVSSHRMDLGQDARESLFPATAWGPVKIS